MPTNAVVQRILGAMEKDNSKVLSLTVDGKTISNQQYIPRARQSHGRSMSTSRRDLN